MKPRKKSKLDFFKTLELGTLVETDNTFYYKIKIQSIVVNYISNITRKTLIPKLNKVKREKNIIIAYSKKENILLYKETIDVFHPSKFKQLTLSALKSNLCFRHLSKNKLKVLIDLVTYNTKYNFIKNHPTLMDYYPLNFLKQFSSYKELKNDFGIAKSYGEFYKMLIEKNFGIKLTFKYTDISSKNLFNEIVRKKINTKEKLQKLLKEKTLNRMKYVSSIKL